MSVDEILRVVLIGMAVLFCPGYALLVVLKQRVLNLVDMCCAAGGVSILAVPLLISIATYLGIDLGLGLILLVLLCSGLVCLWDCWHRISDQRRRASREVDTVHVLLGLVFFATLLARMLMVRGINYPLWTDSYHHTIITDLIAIQGRIPSSYEPYAQIESFSYHFGFHAISAWFHQLSGIPIPRSVVLTGQIINALAVPSSYLLTQRLFRDRIASLVASLVVGLVSHMPASFVNWGRYTQLSGQVVLPVLMVLTLNALDEPAEHTSSVVLVSVGAAGLFLVHVRVFLFYGLFAILLLLFRWAHARRRHNSDQVQRLFISCLAIGGITLIILAPWLWRFFEGFGSTVAQELTSTYHPGRYAAYFRWRLQDLWDYGLSSPLLALAVAGGVLGIVNSDPNIWVLLLWFLSLLAVANLPSIGIVPPFSNLVVSLITYIPGATLIGYLAANLRTFSARFLHSRRLLTRILRAAAVAGTALICLGGVKYTVQLIRPQNGFVGQADLDAMDWIQESTPDDALFYIGTHFWTPMVAHGVDAGYWIPWLSERETVLPPQVYASDGTPEYIEFINQRARELSDARTSEQLWEVMMQYDVTHVYVGSRPTDLRADFLLADPVRFRPVYSEGGAWVFEVNS